ncbi:MAG TPA: hypothetical protein PLO64_05520 [Methanothermobacter sp.]|nr:conserved hypothetical protein [Methanothermobacter sp. MT-2]HHW05060.1 hypothetical protein [Methanothermobacter sp.]HOK72566.1 hypothetical protein [Methanothermobacter sp.]HOL69371.1 hypothetical protein [Methanothermobacter sp.]HPQ04053.1 hypothetical protein [Methanothermobacter sp.]
MDRGQITGEYLLILGFIIPTILLLSYSISDNLELEMAIAAAKDGAIRGADTNELAIYPKDAYQEYENRKEVLLQPSSIQIIKLETVNEGYNETYGKYKIRLIVYAHLEREIPDDCKDSLGDRINYNIRRNICITFKTENITNDFYNPAFSYNYMFTTSDVRWI